LNFRAFTLILRFLRLFVPTHVCYTTVPTFHGTLRRYAYVTRFAFAITTLLRSATTRYHAVVARCYHYVFVEITLFRCCCVVRSHAMPRVRTRSLHCYVAVHGCAICILYTFTPDCICHYAILFVTHTLVTFLICCLFTHAVVIVDATHAILIVVPSCYVTLRLRCYAFITPFC